MFEKTAISMRENHLKFSNQSAIRHNYRKEQLTSKGKDKIFTKINLIYVTANVLLFVCT